MGYYINIGISLFAIPTVMVVFGLLLALRSSKKYNSFFAYRTAMSLKNEEIWSFANVLAGILWAATGFILDIADIFLFRYAMAQGGMQTEMSIYMMGQIVILLLINYPVKKIISRNFDKDGRRL